MELPLGELMKKHEHGKRRIVEDDSYVLLRLDGKAFHTLTRNLKRPYDEELMEAMDETARALAAQVQGVRLAYVQSDEISLLLAPWEFTGSELKRSEFWMGGVEAKLLSLTAAIATATFSRVREPQMEKLKLDEEERQRFHPHLALFDSRLWTFPATAEGRELVQLYFLWRQRDAIKNSVTMAALAHFSHRALLGKHTGEKRELLEGVGAPWEELPEGFRRGRVLRRRRREEEVTYRDGRTGDLHTTTALRSYWAPETPAFHREFWEPAVLPEPLK